MIYPIFAYGHPVLKKKAKDIVKGEIDVKQLSEDMFETMLAAQGVGLAAPQIGKGIRMFVAYGKLMEEEELVAFKRVFINPEIIEEDGEEWGFEEGCLSIPNIREDVFRNERIVIKYFDENWEEHTETFTGMKARIVQHEYDHIEGVLFTDYLSGFKRRLLNRKLKEISRGKVDIHYRMDYPMAKKR